MAIRVVIQTHNRNIKLGKLLWSLADSAVCDLDIHVYDDASRRPVRAKATIHRYEEKHGREGYWSLARDMMRDARQDKKWDLMLWLPDDVVPVKNFWARLLDAWGRIDDPNKVCLNPLGYDPPRLTCWTGFPRVEAESGIWNTQWMDCCGLVTRKFVQRAARLIKNPNPLPDGRGSGVGRMISVGLHEEGFNMYQTKRTLLEHLDHPSEMHPERPRPIVVKAWR